MEYMSDEIKDLATALSKAQSVIKTASKDTEGYGYKYATLDSVQEAAREALSNNGLSYTHLIMVDKIRCILMHESGQYLYSDYPLDVKPSANLNVNQARGSAITYGRRYTLAAIVGIPQEDDDGVASIPKNQNTPKPVKSEKTIISEIFNGYKTKLNMAETKEQVISYSHSEDVKKMFEYANKNSKFRQLLNDLLAKHNLTQQDIFKGE